MARSSERGPTESGVHVYPKLPVPKGVKGRESEPRMHKGQGGSMRKTLIVVGIMLVVGIVVGFIVRPMLMTDPRVAELDDALAAAHKATANEKSTVDRLEKELDGLTAAKATADKELVEAKRAQAQLANQAKDAEEKKQELEQLRAKLKAAGGSATIDGDDLKLTLATGIMFKGNEDQLTPRGKAVLDKLAVPLKGMTDRQIWIIGHTDDTPPPQPKLQKPPQAPPKKGQKPAPITVVTVPVARFPTNWELASLRALAIVHHLQDTSKVDPTRLAAQTFGQYKPASRTNKALNRRIEIVISPKAAR
jgi:flagellar motor protein MotB